MHYIILIASLAVVIAILFHTKMKSNSSAKPTQLQRELRNRNELHRAAIPEQSSSNPQPNIQELIDLLVSITKDDLLRQASQPVHCKTLVHQWNFQIFLNVEYSIFSYWHDYEYGTYHLRSNNFNTIEAFFQSFSDQLTIAGFHQIEFQYSKTGDTNLKCSTYQVNQFMKYLHSPQLTDRLKTIGITTRLRAQIHF